MRHRNIRSAHSAGHIAQRAATWCAAGAALVLGTSGAVGENDRRYDLDGNGQIDGADLDLIIGQWGVCAAPCGADLTGDGVVDGADVAALTERIGQPLAIEPAEPPAATKVIHEAPVGRMPIEVNPDPEPVAHSAGLKRAFAAGVNLHRMAPVTAERIEEADRIQEEESCNGGGSPGPYRVGFKRELDRKLTAADASQGQTLEGQPMWTLAIQSPGSYRMQVHFENFDIGRSEMVIYGHRPDGSPITYGPFGRRGPENDNDFWPAHVPGDAIYIEVVGPDKPQFEINEVVHFDRDPMQAPGGINVTSPLAGGCAPAGILNCHQDANCSNFNNHAIEATGQMTFLCGGGNCSVCTGTLLNDLDSGTTVPYFLTAFHCLSTQSAVNTMTVMWFFESTSCNSGALNPNTQTSSGGTLLVTNPTDPGNDMTFIRLNSAPAGIGLAGWTTASLSSGVGIHHPGGSWKRYTTFTPSSGICFDPNDYDYYDIFTGAIQGGSSGSGIFNASGQLSGQLYGWCGTDCDAPCNDQQDYALMYGEFESTWEDTSVSHWLTLGGTVWVDKANTSPPWDGTSGNAYPTVALGHGKCWNGSRMAIRAGSYNEAVTLSKAITIVNVGGAVTIGQ